jgi:hypothetical protein
MKLAFPSLPRLFAVVSTLTTVSTLAAVSGCSGSTLSAEAEDNDGAGEPADGLGGDSGEGSDEDKPFVPPTYECPASEQGFATEVISHEFGEGQDFGQDDFPESILGGPQGGGCCSGSLDVTSLGDGGHVVLGFGERAIVDGPGPDFIVFENTFWAGGDESAPVAELGQVAVSVDGDEWFEFSCEPGEEPPFGDCVGWRPIFADVTDPESVSPFDADEAGGAAYDLAALELDEARFVRITDIAGDDVVVDLDAVAIVHGRCD